MVSADGRTRLAGLGQKLSRRHIVVTSMCARERETRSEGVDGERP